MRSWQKWAYIVLFFFIFQLLISCTGSSESDVGKVDQQAVAESQAPVVYFAELMSKNQFSVSESYQKILDSNPDLLRAPLDFQGRLQSIYHHPLENSPNTIVFEDRMINQQTKFEADIGIFIQNVPEIVSDGVRFRILVQSGEEKRVLLEESVTEFNRWKSVSADVSDFGGRLVDILFETDPNGTSRQDWAAWGSPRMVQTEITQDFDSKDFDSAQRFRGLINEYGGIPLAGGSRTDRGWIASAFTTEIVLPEIPSQSTLRSEVFVLTPSQNENDNLTISLVSKDGAILERVVHPANVEVKEIADEFELGAHPNAPSKIHYTVSAESTPTLFIKQPVYKQSIQRRESRANVILISLDTLRPDYLGCYGNPNQYSPNIDSFASESLLFQNVYSSSNWTLPAHASLFTSLYSTDHQIVPRSWGGSAYVSFENDYYYLTEAFKEANYVTLAHTGGGFVDSRYGFNRAFDYHIENVVELNEETLANLVSLVETHKEAPHFLFFHTFEIHDYPNQKPKYQRYVTKSFWTGKLSFERRLSAQHFLDLPSFHNIAREILPETGIQYAKELYAGALSRTDELLGSFFQQLRGLDLYDQSWIIVTSDHGEGFGEKHNNNGLTSWRHGRRLYDNQIRIPLIIKPPKGLVRRELPIVEEQFVELVDIAPTLMAVLGKKPHSQFKGRNLLPAFSKPNSIKARAAFSDDIRNSQFSVLADGYKLLASPNREMQMDTRYELYNLVKDSPERRNLIRDLGESDLFYDLKLLLENHIREVSPGRFAYTPGIEEDLDQEHLERLRDLGYIQ